MPHRPHISINLALSADGKISTAGMRPADWTSAVDKDRLRQLRRGADALMVGRGTWDTDRMTLVVRDQDHQAKQPLRCVVSRTGHFDPAHPMFQQAGGAIHLLATEGANTLIVPNNATLHRGSLESFLQTLVGLGVQRLHCEGGGELIKALTELDVIDEIHLTWSGGHLFGGAQAPTLTGVPGAFLPASRHYELVTCEPHGAECFLSYRRADSNHRRSLYPMMPSADSDDRSDQPLFFWLIVTSVTLFSLRFLVCGIRDIFRLF